MKFDMHCHTLEGSPDAKVSIVDYSNKLKNSGFQGMLVSDHNTYKGYNTWQRELKASTPEDFVILRGIEYDTIDAGHFLVIMPPETNLKILEIRGLPVFFLIDIVHRHGGILGPSHPYGERFLSIFNTGFFKHNTKIAARFDFLEAFNACEEEFRNEAADKIAEEYNKCKFGGSDSHWYDCIGHAYTEFPDDVIIKDENDLINYIKSGGMTTCGGERFYGTTKDKLGKLNHVLVQSFWFYNKGLGIIKRGKRKKELNRMYTRRKKNKGE